MRIARIAGETGAQYAVREDSVWAGVEDPFAGSMTPTGRRFPADARLLAPVEPRVLVGMAFNTRPADGEASEEPRAFLKSARTVVGPGDPVRLDPGAGRTIVEGELAVVLRRDAYRLTEEDALDAVLGYTIANDVTAADRIPADAFWTQAKNGRGFAPLGPWIETELETSDAGIVVRVNGRVVAESSTSLLLLGVARQLAYVTRHLELGAGDVVMSGSPGTSHPIRPGDRFDVEVAGLGTLSNHAI